MEMSSSSPRPDDAATEKRHHSNTHNPPGGIKDSSTENLRENALMKDPSISTSNRVANSLDKSHSPAPPGSRGIAPFNYTSNKQRSSHKAGATTAIGSLGAATASYYFNGPPTPVQKMVRSEQEKMLLAASKTKLPPSSSNDDHRSSIGSYRRSSNSTSLNESYLSSSSGEDSTGDLPMQGGDDSMILNTSVLSDTTELTASNFVSLAATKRPTASLMDTSLEVDVDNDPFLQLDDVMEEEHMASTLPVRNSLQPQNMDSRPPLQTITTLRDEEEKSSVSTGAGGPTAKRNRRKSMAVPTMAHHPSKSKDSIAAHLARRRRDTIATFSTKGLGDDNKATLQSQQNAQSDGAMATLEHSESGGTTFVPIRNSCSSATATPVGVDADSTVEGSISAADMQALLNMSAFRVGASSSSTNPTDGSQVGHDSNDDDDSTVILPFRLLDGPDHDDDDGSSTMAGLNDLLNLRKTETLSVENEGASEASKATTLLEHADDTPWHGTGTNPELDDSTASLGDLLDGLMVPAQGENPSDKSPKDLLPKPNVTSVQSTLRPSFTVQSFPVSLTSSPSQANNDEAEAANVASDSPALNTRSKSPTKKNPSTAVETNESSDRHIQRSPKKRDTTRDAESLVIVDSPARNTRSKSPKPKTTTAEALVDRSPARAPRGMSPKKTSSAHDSVLDSPARNTRSRSPMKGPSAAEAVPVELAASNAKNNTEESNLTGTVHRPYSDTNIRSTGKPASNSINDDGTTVTLGGILDDVIVSIDETAQSRVSQSLTTQINQVLGPLPNGQSEDLASPGSAEQFPHSSTPKSLFLSDSMMSRSDVSKASSMSTPAGMAQFHDSSTSYKALSSPPSTIRCSFVPDYDSLPVSSFSLDDPREYPEENMPKPSSRTSLTPTRLQPSPRRFIRSDNNPPSSRKETLTPSKLHQSPRRLQKPMVPLQESCAPKSGSMTPSKLMPSPMRLIPSKRTSEETEAEQAGESHQSIASPLTKRPRNSIEMRSNFIRRTSLPSALRQPGEVRSRTRRVAFGSPSTAEFNILSPSMSLTPLPHPRVGRFSLPSLQPFELEGSNVEAGSTPFQSKAAATAESSDKKAVRSEDDSDMSMDSSLSHDDTQENTVMLEKSMGELFGNRSPTRTEHSSFATLGRREDETTVELENDFNLVLGEMLESSPSAPENKCAPSALGDEEQTMELEVDIDALFDGFTGASDRVEPKEVPPSVSSHRFSIVPSRRLSVSLDGSFHDENETVQLATMAVPNAVNDEQLLDASTASNALPVDITNKELLAAASMEKVYTDGLSDILSEVASRLSVRTWTSGVMNALISQVQQTVLNETTEALTPDAVVTVAAENQDRCRDLQKAIRAGKSQTGGIAKGIRALSNLLQQCNTFEWHAWLISATEQLDDKLEQTDFSVATDAQMLEELSQDLDTCMLAMNSKAARAKRRTHRKDTQNAIDAKQSELRSLEIDLQRSQEQLLSLQTEAQNKATVMESASRTRIIASSVVHMAEQVKSSKQQLITLQGATKWKSFVVTDSELSVHYLGPSANTCAALSFLCNPPTFSLTPQREIFSGHRSVRAKKLVSAASFLNHQIDAVSKELLQTSSLVLSDIGQVFQCLDLRLGRLECTATEIATLKRRYKGKLSHGQDPASKCFQLEINFFDRFDTAKLGAVFAISDQYPFARVDICLNAFVDYLDVEAIHKLLIRSAKPGFGYLSRICDILSTYVH